MRSAPLLLVLAACVDAGPDGERCRLLEAGPCPSLAEAGDLFDSGELGFNTDLVDGPFEHDDAGGESTAVMCCYSTETTGD